MAPNRQSRQEPREKSAAPSEKVPPVALAVETLDGFLSWASRADAHTRPRVAAAIHQASNDEAVFHALRKRLEEVESGELLTSLLLLSVMGEMRSPAAADEFESIIWRPLPAAEKVGHLGIDPRALEAMRQSKAVECLAYLGTDDAYKRTMRVAVDHEARSVRSAAVGALLFNFGESQQDRERIRKQIRPDDAHLVDMTRFSASVSREEFNSRGKAFYERHKRFIPPALEGEVGHSHQEQDVDVTGADEDPPPRQLEGSHK